MYRDLLQEPSKSEALEKIHSELEAIDVQHVFTKDYFSKEGSKQPQEVVASWQAKVDAVLAQL